MIRTQKKHTYSARKIGQIMGIKVTSSELAELLARVEKFVSDSSKLGGRSSKFYILTPNPELILMAQRDIKLKSALNDAQLAIPDGVGLKLAIPGLKIIKGRNLFSDLIALAVKKDWKVFLLGGLGREAELAAAKLQTQNPKLKVQAFGGPKLDKNAEPVTEVDRKLQNDAVEKINKFAPDILFVAFGNPKQEIWVHENYSKLKIGGAMAVGGSFRYLAGVSRLPPKWMAGAGLEWLWRLITEPARVGRIWNAVVVFPLRVFISKILSV